MTDTHDGGPAFPRNGQNHLDTKDGMSLRDWFAGQATERDVEEYRDYYICDLTADCIPRYSREHSKYRYADAMLAARSEVKQ